MKTTSTARAPEPSPPLGRAARAHVCHSVLGWDGSMGRRRHRTARRRRRLARGRRRSPRRPAFSLERAPSRRTRSSTFCPTTGRGRRRCNSAIASERLPRGPFAIRSSRSSSRCGPNRLRADAEEATYRSFLASPARLASARRALLAIRERALDPARQLERMFQIDYLAARARVAGQPAARDDRRRGRGHGERRRPRRRAERRAPSVDHGRQDGDGPRAGGHRSRGCKGSSRAAPRGHVSGRSSLSASSAGPRPHSLN